jgi:hypothetical protein
MIDGAPRPEHTASVGTGLGLGHVVGRWAAARWDPSGSPSAISVPLMQLGRLYMLSGRAVVRLRPAQVTVLRGCFPFGRMRRRTPPFKE